MMTEADKIYNAVQWMKEEVRHYYIKIEQLNRLRKNREAAGLDLLVQLCDQEIRGCELNVEVMLTAAQVLTERFTQIHAQTELNLAGDKNDSTSKSSDKD